MDYLGGGGGGGGGGAKGMLGPPLKLLGGKGYVGPPSQIIGWAPPPLLPTPMGYRVQ